MWSNEFNCKKCKFKTRSLGSRSHPGDMATQLERLQQVHPVSVRDIKEKLQALRKHTSVGALSTSHARRAPVCVKHVNDNTTADGQEAESRSISHTEGTGASFATKRPSRKPSPPPTPVRPPEAPDPPRAGEEPEMTTRTTTQRHRSTTPITRRSCGTSPPPRRRSPSPSQHTSLALDCPPELAEAIRRRVLQVRRGVRLYLLYQPGPRSFLIAADQPDHRFKVVLGPQTCSCGKGPHCVHLLFVMLRVLRLTDTDARLFSKTLKEFEVDELLRGFSISRRRTSQQSEGPLTDDKSPDCPAKNLEDAVDSTSKTGSRDVEGDDASTCPICLLEMFEGESVITCDKGCGNQLHHHCASIWVLQCSRNGEPVVCPLCRCHWKDDRSSSPPLTKKPIQPEDDDEILLPPCPLHCLLRRASDVSPLPRPVGTPSSSAVNNAPPMVMQFFGTEVAQCLMSTVWSEREAAVVEVEAQVTHALRLATSKPMCLEPWGGIEAVQAACCRVISHAIADPVYRVYVTALRCFKSMLVHSPCAILEDLRSLQNRVRNIVRAVLIKCAHGGNKRSRQLSLATLAELARGQAGALSVGSLTQYPAPNGLGADFLLDVVLSEGKQSPSWQGLLSQLLVLGRLVEEFPHLLASPMANTGTINAESLVAIDLAVRAVGHSHVTVIRQGRHLLAGLARLCGRCPTSVARIWNGVSALQGPQRAQVVRLVGAALQEARRSRLFLCATRSPSVERQQEEHLVREQLLHTKKNWASKDDEEEESCNGQRPATLANSPSRSTATFQLPPPTIDPALFGQLVQGDASAPTSETKATDKSLPEDKGKLPTPEKLADSQHSSGRSSWSSEASSSEKKVIVMTEKLTGPAVPPQRAPRSRPNFLPLRRLACSLTSLGQGHQSSAQTTPGSAVTSPVSFSREIAALPAARASSKKGEVINQGPPMVSTRGCDGKTVHLEESASEDDAQDNEFIIFKSVPGLPISFGVSKEGAKGSSYVEGQHWLRGPMLGAGAFSSCYQAMDRSTGTLMAVKQLPFCRSCQRDDKETAEIMGSIWNEIQMMARLEHPHVLPLLGATKHKDQYNVFLEWMAGGSVASLLERYGPFPEVTILRYTYQALSGLAYLHENHILHRDLKGANLLVDSTGQHLKIADFGSASRLQSKATLAGEFQGQLLGTIAFMAPEVLRGENYGRSCDIWSVGCVLIEMSTNAHPWDNCNTMNHLALIYRISCAQSPPPVPKMLSLRTQHLALQCLRLRSEDRPPAADLLSHPAFKETNLHSGQEL